MNRAEFGKLAMALKTYYSKEEKLLPNEQAMALWFIQLQDLDYETAEMAVNAWVATHKWSPSIAEIREQALTIRKGRTPDWGEGWNQVQKAISRYGMYRPEEAVESLDGVTREVVRRMGFRNICMSENAEAERANFRMLYEELAHRRRDDEQLPYMLRISIAERQKELTGGSDLKRIGE